MQPIVTSEDLAKTWRKVDNTPRVDAPRLRKAKEHTPKIRFNHKAQYRKLKQAKTQAKPAK